MKTLNMRSFDMFGAEMDSGQDTIDAYDRVHGKQMPPFDVGDTVYIKSVGLSAMAGTPWVPSNLINKPCTVVEVYRVPCTDAVVWDYDLIIQESGEEVEYIISANDLSATKPF